MALHAGEVAHDDHCATGLAINHTFRLLEAPQLQDAPAGSPGVLALITSAWFFDEVVRSGSALDVTNFLGIAAARHSALTEQRHFHDTMYGLVDSA
ncbi:hypothetical protein VA596_38240 [Amycolatopsis sp., V23-08]|uniref:Guanylate cyclase domain-containing protein n=1 Tax=Amycolatopsis heterodermiae TaxID=3110235 RepID=A0ABU5RHW9_9PSEU|nr:hypothetical protein [Amycolatopsis sp., V23-08]MEA5365420.1 hypothetical protein [Amycolatopsis sp., V23-08]